MKKLHVVLDNIRSVFNVGSFFRTADAVGSTKLYLCGITATPDNPKIVKTALGATESVEWEYFDNTLDAIKQLKKDDVPIFVVELTPQAEHFQKIQYPDTVALVFGHERKGVSELVLQNADKVVFIPMSGIKESLNVSVAGGIIMYEARWRKDSSKIYSEMR